MNQEKELFLKTLHAKISELPFHRLLGLNKDSFDMENGCIRFDMRDELVGNSHFKILHGGVIASMLDSEAAFVLAKDGAWRFETGSPEHPLILKGGTIDLRIDYLRPGRGNHFVASGTILRAGKKVAVVTTELRNEQDELIAVGTGTYLVG
jgi:acyl-coenzyme A thioesterase PaaI-like protein